MDRQRETDMLHESYSSVVGETGGSLLSYISSHDILPISFASGD